MSELAFRVKSLEDALWHRLSRALQFLAANRTLLVYLAVVAFVAFGYDLVTFSLKADSELHAVDAGPKLAWISEGRWAMYYLNAALMPDPVMPFVPMLTGLLGLAAGVLFLLLSLSGQRTLSDYLAAPLAIGCPMLAFGFYFTTLGYGLGVAVAAAGAGQYALTRWRWSAAAWAIPCFAVAIGIYQSTLLLMPVLFGFYLIAQIIATPHLTAGVLLRRLGLFCAVLLAACAAYEAMKTITLHVYRVPYAKEYLQGYLNWTAQLPYWKATIAKTVSAGKAYYTGDEAYYLYELRVLAVLFWLALAVTAARVVAAPQPTAVKIIGFIALVGSLGAPLLMHLVNAGFMPPRTVLGVPFVLAGLVFCASLDNSKALTMVLGMLVVACFLRFAVVNGRYALANELTWKADQDLSLLILQRVHSVLHKVPDSAPPYPVVLVGMFQPRQSPLYVLREPIGASFYFMNGGNVGRVVSLWRSMRHFEYREASTAEALAVAGHAATMPVWPAEGAVDVVGGTVVVKVGDYTGGQIMTLCDHAPTSDFCERNAQWSSAESGATSAVFSPVNYQGLWWNAPTGSEPGWGIELAHQGDRIYASWFTYDTAGRSWWLAMSAQRRAYNVYAGTLVETRGPPFVAATFKAADLVSTPVGTGTLRFADSNNGTFDYTVKGVRQLKAITRAVFGRMPTCTFGPSAEGALVTNYQGLWWEHPAGESGWGINLNHHGDTLVGTWVTYDIDGAPLWLAVNAPKKGPALYVGDVQRKSGARFDMFDASAVRSTKVGTASLAFADGNNATFSYTIDGVGPGRVTGTKTITRAVFTPPGTVCR